MKRITLAMTLIALALAVAACGGSSKKSASASSTTASPPATGQTQTQPSTTSSGSASNVVSISADPSGALKFSESQATAKAGQVTLKFANPASVPHGLSIEGPGVDKDGKIIMQGGTSTLSVKLKPGKYTYYCPVPGHRQAGMQGTLTVQ